MGAQLNTYRRECQQRAINYAEPIQPEHLLRPLNGQQKHFLLLHGQAIPRALVEHIADRLQAAGDLLRQAAKQKGWQQHR